MRKTRNKPTDDLLPEYDFASMEGRVRGKYVDKYRAGTNLVLLDPELAEAFPTDAAVNEVLRAVLDMSKSVRLPASPQKSAGRRRRSAPASRR